jgi:hypothetical protein
MPAMVWNYTLLTCSAFWWNNVDKANTVVLSSKVDVSSFQVVSSLVATDRTWPDA